jgi:hypothetical protein
VDRHSYARRVGSDDRDELSSDVVDEDRWSSRALRQLRGPWGALAMVVAFAIGVVGGGLGMSAWRNQQDARSREGTVNLVARVFGNNGSDPLAGDVEPWSVALTVTNAGPVPVRVTQAVLSSRDLTSSLRPVSRGVTIQPSGSSYLAFDVVADCRAADFTSPVSVALRVTTPDGQTRQVLVRLADDNQSIAAMAQQSCQDPATALGIHGEYGGPARSLTRDGRPAILTQVTLRLSGARAIRVTEIHSASVGLAIIGAPLPIAVNRDAVSGLGLTWTVTRCADALRLAPSQFTFSANVELAVGRTVTSRASLDSDSGYAVTRFVAHVCSPR